MPLQATVKEDDKAHEERTSQGLVTQLLLHLHPVNGTQGMKKVATHEVVQWNGTLRVSVAGNGDQGEKEGDDHP